PVEETHADQESERAAAQPGRFGVEKDEPLRRDPAEQVVIGQPGKRGGLLRQPLGERPAAVDGLRVIHMPHAEARAAWRLDRLAVHERVDVAARRRARPGGEIPARRYAEA